MLPKKNVMLGLVFTVVPLFHAGSTVMAADAPAPATVAAPAPTPAMDPAKMRERGQILALSCSGCHGTDGKSSSIMPSIYGKTTGYIESALLDFKSGARMSTVMGRHAKGYTPEEIHLIAEYFGNLSKKKN
ncbi:c-type cytochrome [Chlorobaculum thiosulfatiphilum]|jgi:cytochrome subunit of sulfide dehydrogenase|nr:c-type cytochrome [Chlorobaculum thiosulfatiphilum]